MLYPLSYSRACLSQHIERQKDQSPCCGLNTYGELVTPIARQLARCGTGALQATQCRVWRSGGRVVHVFFHIVDGGYLGESFHGPTVLTLCRSIGDRATISN